MGGCTGCHGTGKRTIWVAGKPFILVHVPCPGCGGSGIVSRCETLFLAARNDNMDNLRLVKFANNFARRLNLVDEERVRLQIILDELFSNVLKYGYEDETARRHVEVGLTLENDQIIIEFVDDGRPFDPLTSPPPALDLPLEDRSMTGIGIAIVRGLVDEATYHRDDDRNHLTLRRIVAATPPSSVSTPAS